MSKDYNKWVEAGNSKEKYRSSDWIWSAKVTTPFWDNWSFIEQPKTRLKFQLCQFITYLKPYSAT